MRLMTIGVKPYKKYGLFVMNARFFQFFIIIIFTISTSSAAKAEWKNPSEKYINAYKAFLNKSCPIAQDDIKHFVYFARDRERIHNHPFLSSRRFVGAQIMYSWAQLEPKEDKYSFSVIEDDFNYLKKNGKKLFIQLQDATFSINCKGVPAYLLDKRYDGGVICQRYDNGEPEGWTAKRWNKNVQVRFAKLLNALGRQFDGKVEGINLQETAIGVSNKYDETFTPEKYVEALKINMLALKKAFPRSTTMQYANFMPGEWLPWEDYGYLKSIYEYGEEIGVGLGAPDLMVKRKGQLNHAIAMMHEHKYSVPLGIAVQDGNYIGLTNTTKKITDHKNLVPLLHAFAKEFMRVNYMFWVDQKPYFQEDVLTCFAFQ